MNKLLASLAIAALIGSLAPSAFATPRGGRARRTFEPTPIRTTLPSATIVHGVINVNHGNFTDYHLRVGIHFEHGIYYKGRDHFHWTLSRFDARYGCECYWDPYSLAWYYWCEPDQCFYPVTYAPHRTYAWRPAVLVGPVVSPGVVVSPGTVLPTTAVSPVGEVPAIPAPLVFRP
jgi:hypothetical protein